MANVPSTICCDVSCRGRLRVTGEDRIRFLNGQVTQDVARLPSGRGCFAIFTSAKGKTRADAIVLNMGECLWVDLEPGNDQRLAAELEKFIIADDVVIENHTASGCAYTLVGDGASEALRQSGLCGAPPKQAFEIAKLDPASNLTGFLFKSRRSVYDSFDVWVEDPGKPQLVGFLTAVIGPLGGRMVDSSALEILRVEAGIPRFGSEMDENTLPQEAGIEAVAISYTKGCYIGQEVMSRIKSMGRVNRTLVRLQLPPTAQTGDPLSQGDRQVGRVGTAVTSSPFGRIGLAIVRREASTPDSVLSLPQGAAKVVENFQVQETGVETDLIPSLPRREG